MSSDSPDSLVLPNSKVTYTVEGRNTGVTVLDPVRIEVELPNDTSYSDDAVARVLGGAGSAARKDTQAPVTRSGATLSWSGALGPGQRVQIVYSVWVSPAVFPNTVLRSSLRSEASPPRGKVIKPRPVRVEVRTPPQEPAQEPGYEQSVFADPLPGAAVPPGSKITYTAEGLNTGTTLAAAFESDMSQLLDKASYNNDATVRVLDAQGNVVTPDNGQPPPPQLEGATLSSFYFELQQGQRLQMVYSVTLNQDVRPGQVLKNKFTSLFASSLKPVSSTIEHTVASSVVEPQGSGYEQSKSSDAAPGMAGTPGARITYTVEGRNKSESVLEAARLEDDMSPMLHNASYNDDAAVRLLNPDRSAVMGAVEAPVLTGTILSWSGVLQPGQIVQLVYSVTVNNEAVTPDAQPEGTEGSTPSPAITPINPAEPAVAIGPAPGGESLTAAHVTAGSLAGTGLSGAFSFVFVLGLLVGISGLVMVRSSRRG